MGPEEVNTKVGLPWQIQVSSQQDCVSIVEFLAHPQALDFALSPIHLLP